MQLIFTHFFRPRWQHPKPGIRRKAIRKLKPDHPSDQQILQQLARLDQDIDVRCSALDKLVRPELLREIAEHDPTPQVRREAIRRFCQLICEPGPEQLSAGARSAQLEQLNDPDVLTHITLNADSPEIQLAAVSRIRLEGSLHQIILSSDSFQIRQVAAEGIETPELLDELIRHCRQRDKRLYRLFKDRRDLQKQQARELASQLDSCEKLCAGLQKLASDSTDPHYQARVNALKQRWQEQSSEARAPFSEAWEAALTRCLQNQQDLQQARQQEEIRRQLLQQQQQLLNDFSQQLEQIHQQPPLHQQLQQQLQQYRSQWSELTAEQNAREQDQQLFDSLFDRSSGLLESLIRYDQQQAPLSQLLRTDAPASQLQSLLDSIRWPDRLPLPDLIAQAQTRIDTDLRQKQARSEQQNRRKQEVDQLLDQLEQSLAQGQLQAAGTQLKKLKPLCDKLGNQFRGGQKQRYQRLNASYLELGNWQAYATQPKLEQLCQQMEQLITEELDNDDRATRIRELQQQWKQLDSSTTPPQLRNRFQQANQQAYAPCQQYYDQQREQRQQNLEQRQRLFDQLSQALTQCRDSGNYRELAALYRDSKQQWRKFSPVDRAPGKKLQGAFNRLLAQVSDCLDEDQQRNAAAKEALLTEARSLLEAIGEPAEAAALNESLHQAKALQKQWRTVGPAQRRQEQQLWREFRSICNQLFGLRDTLPSEADNAVAAEPTGTADHDSDWPIVERRHQLCAALEMELLMEARLTISEQQLDAWRQGKFPAAPCDELLQQRFSLLQQLQDNPDQLDALMAETEQQLRLLCIRLEILAGAASPEEDQVLRMEYQMAHLQQALEQRHSEPCASKILALQKHWHCLPFNQCHTELRRRFEQHLDAADTGS